MSIFLPVTGFEFQTSLSKPLLFSPLLYERDQIKYYNIILGYTNVITGSVILSINIFIV